MTEEIRKYFAEIGRKGGMAGKGSPRRIASNRRTAQNRWRRVHPKPKPIQKDAVL